MIASLVIWLIIGAIAGCSQARCQGLRPRAGRQYRGRHYRRVIAGWLFR